MRPFSSLHWMTVKKNQKLGQFLPALKNGQLIKSVNHYLGLEVLGFYHIPCVYSSCYIGQIGCTVSQYVRNAFVVCAWAMGKRQPWQAIALT